MHGKELLDALGELRLFIKNEHIKLVSGYHSDSYIYVRNALDFQYYAKKISEELAEEFQGDGINTVLGFTKSGNTLAQIIAEHLKAKAVVIDILDGNFVYITGDEITRGDVILIVDDVLTTGNSIRKALSVISNKTQGKVTGIGVVVDRSVKKPDFGVKFVRLARVEMNLWRSPKSCPKCLKGVRIIDLSKLLPISTHRHR